MNVVVPLPNYPSKFPANAAFCARQQVNMLISVGFAISWIVAEELGTLEGTPATLTIEKCPRLRRSNY
jgi:hypothetical protein